jgi:hypothetical protein
MSLKWVNGSHSAIIVPHFVPLFPRSRASKNHFREAVIEGPHCDGG